MSRSDRDRDGTTILMDGRAQPMPAEAHRQSAARLATSAAMTGASGPGARAEPRRGRRSWAR
ncbi:hypothetical protein OHB54_02390 [Streptomyces sp. NBC_01007]|nr:hypothetical protein OHB54_02390 [Streptomyces sp. NBC_01007]